MGTPTMVINDEPSTDKQTHKVVIAAISRSDVNLDDVTMFISSTSSPLPISQYEEATPWVNGNFTMYYVDRNHDSMLSVGDAISINFTQKDSAPFGVGIIYRPTGGMMCYLNIE